MIVSRIRPSLHRPANLRSLAFLLILSIASTALGDALDWSETSQSFETGFYDEEVTATYEFTNTSDQTVSIVESKATCGCTVPSLDKTNYAPGESGELTAIFTIGSRQGKQQKYITVVTENESGESEEYELTLNVDIPVPVTLTPRVRFWQIAENAETQSIEVTLHEKRPLSINDIRRRDENEPPRFDVELETVEANHKYVVHITPLAPTEKSRDVFFLHSEDDRQDSLRKYPIYAYIR